MSIDIHTTATQQKVDVPISHYVSRYTYQPNFVLVNENTHSSLVFGDLIPFYKSYRHLSEVIVTSVDSFVDFILNSHVFLVCVLSLLSQALNNVTYQAYILLTESHKNIIALPDTFSDLKKKYFNLVEIITNEQTRQLWWLDTRLSVVDLVDSIIENLFSTLHILRRFYLFTIVIIFLSVLTISGASASTSSVSTLGKYVDGTSFEILSQTPNKVPKPSEILTVSSVITPVKNTSKIFEYTVQQNDTIDSIAEKFSLQISSVKVNNNITDTVSVGSKIILPWKDAYIYKAPIDISAGELERIYGISKQDILTSNEGIVDGELFKKDTLALIPSANFEKIAQANRTEEVRRTNITRASAVRVTGAPDLSQGSDIGLIFPTSKEGTRVSRCLQPGHIACDFANFSSPPIFAAKTGRILAAKYGYNSGYGNFVKIDHGNGVVTSYMHLTEIYVKEGQTVIQGETIGQMGTTGNSSGIHLHFEVIINGILQSPGRFLPWMPPCESSCSW